MGPSRHLEEGNNFMGCFSSSTPQPTPVNYTGVIGSTLSAQAGEAPEQFAAESNPVSGQPAYANLSLENLGNLLYGSPATSNTETYNDVQTSTGGWYDDQTGQFESANSNPGNATYYGNGQVFTTPVTQTINTPATTGVVPQTQALLTSDPAINALLGGLNSQAATGLAAGDQLTPDQMQMVNQQSLAGFAQRGVSGSGSSVVDAILNQLGYGQQLLSQRQNAGAQAIQANQSAYLNPLLNIVGNTIGGTTTGGPNLFNPQAGLSTAQSNASTQAQWDAAQPTGIQQTGEIAQLGGSAIGGIGAIAGLLSLI
jgi:hypothetical protein